VGAAPVGQDTGLADIKQMIRSGIPESDETMGEARSRDTLADYAGYLRKLVELSGIRPLTVVVDAGNGMAGYTVPAVLGEEAGLPALPMSIDRMYFELDGTFPNHEANPIEPKNLVDIQARVRSIGADIGLAFDGDADRCFVIDEGGRIVNPSTLTALIAARELQRSPGSTIIHNLITSKAVPEVVFECGGSAVKTRVGHSFIKATMAETDAVFGGEHSGHFYFRDFWRADSGMLAAMHTLAALGSTPEGTTISSLLTEFERYVASGEINTPVEDQSAMMELIEATFTGNNDVTTDHMDGLTVDGGQWWFNVRPSNTEPLLRLNVEAREADTMETLRDEVLALMRGGAT
jgi:phosphomannomutase